jgi:hypothetical protein
MVQPKNNMGECLELSTPTSFGFLKPFEDKLEWSLPSEIPGIIDKQLSPLGKQLIISPSSSRSSEILPSKNSHPASDSILGMGSDCRVRGGYQLM